jgi:cytochrome oxidase Cu insertion factor (SCO1/SenC/PrrC family)
VSTGNSAAEKSSGGDRWIIGVMVFCAVVGLAGGWWAGQRKPLGLPPDRPRQLTDFSLTDRSGRTVTRGELTNQFLVVNFVFSSCSVSCQQVSQNMAEVQRLTATQPDVRLVSFSVDPRTDTPDVLARFADKFGADTNRWLLLTGEKPAVYAVIEGSFLTRSEDSEWAFMPGNFVHAERIAVVDPAGNVRSFFDGMSKRAPGEIVELIHRLRPSLSRP